MFMISEGLSIVFNALINVLTFVANVQFVSNNAFAIYSCYIQKYFLSINNKSVNTHDIISS